MSAKSDGQAAQAAVAAYHETQLAALAEHVGTAIDRFRGGELDAIDVEQVPFQYSRAAKELWKFCNFGDIALNAIIVRARPTLDWWERGASRRG